MENSENATKTSDNFCFQFIIIIKEQIKVT